MDSLGGRHSYQPLGRWLRPVATRWPRVGWCHAIPAGGAHLVAIVVSTSSRGVTEPKDDRKEVRAPSKESEEIVKTEQTTYHQTNGSGIQKNDGPTLFRAAYNAQSGLL